MALHHKTKEKYLNLIREQGLSSQEVKEQLLSEGQAAEDVDAFLLEAFGEGASDENKPAGNKEDEAAKVTKEAEKEKKDERPEQVKQENEIAKATAKASKKHDYKDLDGENFKAYEADVASLPLHDFLDFQQFKVEPIIKELYPGLPKSPKYMSGIRIVNDQPINTTRITPATAMALNNQVRNSNRYYLLKQD